MGDQATSGSRRGFWFPLAFFGFGLLGLLGWDSMRVAEDFGWFAYAPLTSNVPEQHLVGVTLNPGMQVDVRTSAIRDWPWAVLVTATMVATIAWYGWRARRAGGSVRAHVAWAVGVGIAVPGCYAVVGMTATVADPPGLITSVGLPLVALGAVTGAWAYFRRGPWRRTAAVVGIGCLGIGAAMALGAWAPGLIDPVLVTGGLLVLAWFERSRLVAVVGGALLVAMLVFPDGPMSMLIPAVIALAAGIVALTRPGTAPA